MARRSRPPHRTVEPDALYNNILIARFINRMMFGGKKSTARGVMYRALSLVEERAKRDPVEVFEQAMRSITPAVEVKPRRVGGSTYQVPIEVESARGVSLAVRWMLAAARSRAGRSMAEKLAAEILDAANGQGAAIKRKDETHRMAEANRAFASYRW
jgi:small subunit ribosomal protein S7